jgi:hypothetical protein
MFMDIEKLKKLLNDLHVDGREEEAAFVWNEKRESHKDKIEKQILDEFERLHRIVESAGAA